ncbi:MAG: cob(I)yrinic acid a,c-diamide adenosyltransferase [Selenomonadaceae bacterium]|nr:cob(I)yrinic acid a,c-diamide adenosyltransferase [Selenomonadaceae bacterium]
MSVYTKTGDKGETSLYTGERVAKSSLRVETYGTVDEAGAALGLARSLCQNDEVRGRIRKVQEMLPKLMADLASLGQEPLITSQQVVELEKAMDELEARLPPLTSFLISGDSQGGAALDVARTVLRRAERHFCRLSAEEATHESDRLLLNRLSDYVFLLMRLEEE